MGGIRPSGMHINKPVVIGILAVLFAFMLIYKLWWSQPSVESFSAFNFGWAGGSDKGVSLSSEIDVTSLSAAPKPSPEVEAKLTIDAKEIEVPLGANKLTVFRQLVNPPEGSPKLDILLLHGAAFTSANWTQNKVLITLASWGYRAVAIDLPGRGKSSGALEGDQLGPFMGAFITAAGLTNVVIVAPSASGAAALPYLFDDPKTSTSRAKGFVPVAPVMTDTFGPKFKDSKLQTLIVYGTDDPNGPTTARNLQLLENSRTAPIPGAGHPCYLHKPELFLNVMYSWLSTLS